MMYVRWQCQSGSRIPPFSEEEWDVARWSSRKRAETSPWRRRRRSTRSRTLCADECQFRSLLSPLRLPLRAGVGEDGAGRTLRKEGQTHKNVTDAR